MADIFISYSSKDRPAIKRISEFFESQGWTTWWDRQIPVAESFESVLMGELEKSRCVVVVWSKNSIKSQWVKREAEIALQTHKYVPVMLRPVNIPAAFTHIEAAFPESWLNNPENDEIQNLLGSVSKIVSPQKKLTRENPPLWRSWSIRHTYLFIGIFVTLILYILYLLFLKGWRLAHFQVLRLSVFFGISAAVLYCLYNKFCIDKNIIAPGISQIKKTSVWLIPVVAFVLNISLLPVAHLFKIYGKIESKNGQPVNDAQVSIDGTPYYAHSMSDGTYDLELTNYELGDKIVLHVNHDNFEDSERGINLSAFVVKDSAIILNPIDTSLNPIDTSALTLNHEKFKANP